MTVLEWVGCREGERREGRGGRGEVREEGERGEAINGRGRRKEGK